MGRKRLNPDDKKIVVTLSIKKKYVDALKAKHGNLSQIVESLIEKYLNR